MKLADLIAPMSEDVFNTLVLGKKPFVFYATDYKKKFFSDIITWKQFSDYINNHRAVSGLQVITKTGKLCMEKGNLFADKKPHWTKEERFEVQKALRHWNSGDSIILTKASMLTPNISAIAGCIEASIPDTAADAHFYCSPREGSLSFPVHADEDDNFLIHAIGTVRWQVYARGSQTECIIDKVLGPGDMLYIPKGIYHKAEAKSARISISVPMAKHPGVVPLNRNYCDFTKNSS